jgi:ribulose 1,5-bisphosphate carboxylase large subunit-like protein
MGHDLIAQCGGGCHGHKLGTIAGAKAIRQAVDAVMAGTPIRRHAKMHKELRIALKQWGVA